MLPLNRLAQVKDPSVFPVFLSHQKLWKVYQIQNNIADRRASHDSDTFVVRVQPSQNKLDVLECALNAHSKTFITSEIHKLTML